MRDAALHSWPHPHGARPMKLLAIVPAFNEQHLVGQVVDEIRAAWPSADVMVVDDGSRDETAARASAAGARVLRMPFNVGISGAVQAGYKLAWEEGYDAAVQIDGDGQHPADQLPLLLDELHSTDANLVIGSRFARKRGYRSTRSRRGGILLLSWLVSRIAGRRLSDTTSGFRVADRDTIELFAAHYPPDYPEVESIVLASRLGLKVTEVSVEMRQRRAGQSSITPIRSAYYMVKVLLGIGVLCIGRPPIRLETGR